MYTSVLPGGDDWTSFALEEGCREEADKGERRQHLGPEAENVICSEHGGLEWAGGQEIVDWVLKRLQNIFLTLFPHVSVEICNQIEIKIPFQINILTSSMTASSFNFTAIWEQNCF